MQYGLLEGFLASVEKNPNQTAISAASGDYSYDELYIRSSSVAKELSKALANDQVLTPVLAEKGVDAYSGILGVLMSGSAYVPLNLAFPISRIASIINQTNSSTVVVDRSGFELLSTAPELYPSVNKIIVIGSTSNIQVPENFDIEVILGCSSCKHFDVPNIPEDSLAYVLYTSGSTGVPKGVKVTHGSISRYIDYMFDRYQLTPYDRVAQMTELTFDLSVFDQFITWKSGATLCVPAKKDMLFPAAFLVEKKVTVTLLVPSMVVLMRKLRQLSLNVFEDIRISLFCGEALPQDLVLTWSGTVPNARIENIYGPTELTVTCLIHPWNASDPVSDNAIVPIGTPHRGVTALIVDENGDELAAGEKGELVISGYATDKFGYWRDEEKTNNALCRVNGRDEKFYRTGDVAIKSTDGVLRWLARMDQQIKYHGHRIELGDIEASIRNNISCNQVVVIPWPIKEGFVEGLVAFVDVSDDSSEDEIATVLQANLPKYMLPKDIRLVSEFPLNTNGKVDRLMLKNSLGE
ncbi:Linear gramicidin synthase subunit D [Sinobacterium norvegicum]|uniref:Linear gramicidin synthase subunit D n=1 Tax=Sinobacterium norvegicum TaxID=1641715 RepID=A0ABN8EIT1_9GAMM|nr:AMP-binding protein [Sinobacterium norvegicum]CAH0992281.1 Linear gramicidin synthase subunit D [Sinobacterium norvegicum]